MRFLRRNAPDVPLEKVADVLVEEYGVEGDLTTLESERDQNVRVDTAERSYLFKVCNADEDVGDLLERNVGCVASQEPHLGRSP